MMAMLDTLEWPVVFLGCILAGVVPIAANTLLDHRRFRLHAARFARAGAVRFQSRCCRPSSR
jgi:benzoate-CoA ligase